MFETIKAVLNNLNQGPYRKNIKKMEVMASHSNRDNSKNIVTEEYSLDELNRLETSVREMNLKVFLGPYLDLQGCRFLIVTLPAILTATSISLIALPNRYDKNEKVDVFTGDHTLYNSELGVTEYSEKFHLRSVGEYFSGTTVSPNSEEEIKSVDTISSNSLNFKMFDEVNSFLAKFSISSDGKLTLNNHNIEDIIDINDYDDYDFANLDKDYDMLVSKVINILSSSEVLNEQELETLNALSESDKKIIIAEVIKYSEIEQEKVLVSKSRLGLTIIMVLITIFWYAVLVMLYKDMGTFKAEERTLVNRNGELYYNGEEKEEFGLIFGAIYFRQEFLEAERQRILRIRQEIDENTYFDGTDAPILSKYEKKLLNKN